MASQATDGMAGPKASKASPMRRLRSVRAALAAAESAAVEPSAEPPRAVEQASLSAEGLTLLKDDDVKRFCADGFLLIQPQNMTRADHEDLFRQLEASNEGGNNLMAKVPDLMRVYTDPAILGAGRSLAGPGCNLHSHRHAHMTTGSAETDPASQQAWHKDPFFNEPHARHKHAFRWVFALYFPQDTPMELGGTAILRNCHALMGIGDERNATAGNADGSVTPSAFGITAESGFVDPALPGVPEFQAKYRHPVICPAGSVAFIHMDSWHGAGANIVDQAKRFMLKLHYIRMVEPCVTGPTWDHDPSQREWSPQTDDDVTPRASKATWDWLCGNEAPAETVAGDVSSLMAGLEGSEPERVDAALALGVRAQTDASVAPALIDTLRSERQGQLAQEIMDGWAASISPGFNPAALRSLNPADTEIAHSISACGGAVLPALLDAMDGAEEPWWVKSTVASVLGSIGRAASEAAASDQLRIADGLLEALSHSHLWVRWNAADSLGTVLPSMEHLRGHAIVKAIIDGLAELADEDSGDVEAETVRLSAMTSLAKLAGQSVGELGARGIASAVRNMQEIRSDRLNGTVRHYAAAALRRDGSAAAMAGLVDGLLLSRML